MTDQDPKDDQNDELLDEIDAETVEDLEVDGAEDIEGGYHTTTTVVTFFSCVTQ